MVVTRWHHEQLHHNLESLVEEALGQLDTKLGGEISSHKGPKITLFELTKAAAFAGKARAIAGPRPLHKALTPSVAIVFFTQSRKPE